jgi:hypothetical protein
MRKNWVLVSLFVMVCSVCCVNAFSWCHDSKSNHLVAEPVKKEGDAYTKAISIYKSILKNYPEETQLLSQDAFVKGYLGNLQIRSFLKNKYTFHSNVLSICDFTLSSNLKRLWIFNLDDNELIMHSLVSHGKNTGEEYAETFSNKSNSYQSSLGFYLTGDTYEGSNGYSLKLIGLDKFVNDKAEQRAIVMHGAPYCSEAFIAEHGRLGRSFGCPSVPMELHQTIIDAIKQHTVLYIYHEKQQKVLASSKWLKIEKEVYYAQDINKGTDSNSIQQL